IFFHAHTARANRGFSGFTAGARMAFAVQYDQCNGTSRAFHSNLKLYVPEPRDDRPKSKRLNPRSAAKQRMFQYMNTFGSNCKCSCSAELQFASSDSAYEVRKLAATVFLP